MAQHHRQQERDRPTRYRQIHLLGPFQEVRAKLLFAVGVCALKTVSGFDLFVVLTVRPLSPFPLVSYDFEEVDADGANKMNERLREMVGPKKSELVGKQLGPGLVVKDCDDFEYTDPIDGSVSKKQGIRVIFEDGSRIIYRLSGTGSHGATVRIYFEQYEGWFFATFSG